MFPILTIELNTLAGLARMLLIGVGVLVKLRLLPCDAGINVGHIRALGFLDLQR